MAPSDVFLEIVKSCSSKTFLAMFCIVGHISDETKIDRTTEHHRHADTAYMQMFEVPRGHMDKNNPDQGHRICYNTAFQRREISLGR